jgi:hypothetical protein
MLQAGSYVSSPSGMAAGENLVFFGFPGRWEVGFLYLRISSLMPLLRDVYF